MVSDPFSFLFAFGDMSLDLLLSAFGHMLSRDYRDVTIERMGYGSTYQYVVEYEQPMAV